MQSEQLFEAALGVASPWYVRESRFEAEARDFTQRKAHRHRPLSMVERSRNRTKSRVRPGVNIRS